MTTGPEPEETIPIHRDDVVEVQRIADRTGRTLEETIADLRELIAKRAVIGTLIEDAYKDHEDGSTTVVPIFLPGEDANATAERLASWTPADAPGGDIDPATQKE